MLVVLSTLVNSQEAMRELGSVRFAAPVTFRNRKFFAEYAEVLKRFGEALNGLREQYGEKNTKGVLEITPASPKWAEYIAELDALAAEEVELPDPIFAEADFREEGLSLGAALVLEWLLNPKEKIHTAEAVPYAPSGV